jgi:hypothetical protein
MEDLNQTDIQEDVGGQQEAPEENQDEEMPTSEQTSTEEGEEGALPNEVSERTRKEFEKLKGTNKELSEKLRKYEGEETLGNVFDSLFTPQQKKQVPQQNLSHLNEVQVDNIATKFVDDDGTVDINALNQALVQANERAKQAEQQARLARQSVMQDREQREVAEAHAKHPWLDPKNPNFDRKGFELVRDRIVRNMVEGKHKPLVSIAEEVMEVYKPSDQSTAEKAVKDYKDSQVKKAQASSVQSGRGQPRETNPLSDLRERTSRGDISAIEERIKALTSN